MNIGKVYLGVNNAGLFTLGWEEHPDGSCSERPCVAPSYYVHLLVYPRHWVWGHVIEPFHLESFGLGPFLLVCWSY